MERRINKRIESYITDFKDDIRKKAETLGLVNDLNLSSKSDIKKTQTTKKDNQNLDIELLDYVKKTNYDTESLYNISLLF